MSAQLILGKERTLYLGPLASPLSLSLAASRLLVALEQPLWIRAGHERQAIACRTALLPVGGRFQVDSGRQPVADFHLNVTGTDLERLSQAARAGNSGHWFAHLSSETALVAECRRLHASAPPPDAVAATLANLVEIGAPHLPPVGTPDPRILATIEHIRLTVTGNPSLTELAQRAGLSRSRLANLFKSQVGVPIRRYRLWHRLFVACTHMARGTSVTEAALNSGFSDAAHLSHTFREILDIAPSDLFGPSAQLNVVVEPMVSLATDMA